MKKVILLGGSGSIGLQTIDVILEHPDEFEVLAIAIGKNIQVLEEKIIPHHLCTYYHVASKEDAELLQAKYPDYTFSFGDDNLCQIIEHFEDDVDIVINALVGVLGLKPSLKTLELSLDLALANKESLVIGGELVTDLANKNNCRILPIDSEHSAIWQCLKGNEWDDIEKLIITASGGSFRDLTRNQLENVSVEDALNHPNWSMGSRITIDSATMMNKAFEIVEAHYLFDVPFNKIEVLIHRQSIIHSMVQYVDGSVMAQLGSADMRLPIQYALTYPNRDELKVEKRLDFTKIKELTFEPLSNERYPLIDLAKLIIERKGNLGAIINGADEQAIQYFLNGKISFLDIEKLIFKAVEEIAYIEKPNLEQLIESDKLARAFIDNEVEKNV